MIKLVHFIHGLTTGGAETLVKDYVLNMNKSQYDITVLCLSRHGAPYEKLLEDNGIKVQYVSDHLIWPDTSNFVIRFFNVFLRSYYTSRLLRELKPDILHSHLPINDFVLKADLPNTTKIFHTVHSEPKAYWVNVTGWMLRYKRKTDFAAANYLAHFKGMRFLALHDRMQKEIDELFAVKNTIIVNNGIDKTRFKNCKKKSVVRKEIGVPEDAFVLGHVGRFHPVKNHDFLVDIFKKVNDNNPKAYLLMIGSGETMSQIKKKLHDLKLDNRYMILSNRTDVPDLLNAMDVFVLPSHFEGVPVSLVEAQEVELPCFASSNITRQVCISNIINYLDINEKAENWANKILNFEKPQKIIVNDEEWDMKKITLKLDKIYNGEI